MVFDWRNAHHQCVRDLGWALFSPALVNALPPLATAPWQPVFDRGARELLAHLDTHPRQLEDHLHQNRDRRLGAYFESLWTFFLSQHPGYRLLAHNFPITADGNTMGALDLLFEDHSTGQILHGELAVKFYLYYPAMAGATERRWIGPNPDDSLHQKLEHLAQHQLALSATPEAQQQLRQACLPPPDRHIAHIKGRLFSPLAAETPLPSLVNPGCLRGSWLHRHQLDSLLASHPGARWQVLDKSHWFAPRHHHGLSARELREKAATAEQPLMVLNQAATKDRHFFFVMPDSWPGAQVDTCNPTQ